MQVLLGTTSFSGPFNGLGMSLHLALEDYDTQTDFKNYLNLLFKQELVDASSASVPSAAQGPIWTGKLHRLALTNTAAVVETTRELAPPIGSFLLFRIGCSLIIYLNSSPPCFALVEHI